MPAIVVNELSAVSQAKNPTECDTIMRTIAETLRALEPIRRGGSLYAHRNLGNHYLSDKESVYGWLVSKRARQVEAFRLALLKLLTNGPNVDVLLEGVEHTCHQEIDGVVHDRTDSALALVAHLDGWLLSFRDCPAFPRGDVRVEYRVPKNAAQSLSLTHFTDTEDVDRFRPIYEPNEKHDRTSKDEFVAHMDLGPEEAQRLLDRAVRLPSERRMMARHPDSNRIYVFHAHRENRYHGFPMSDEEAEKKMPELYRRL